MLDARSADGCEPCREGNDITLANCPFHLLARGKTELVCGMNLAYLQGMVDGATSPGASLHGIAALVAYSRVTRLSTLTST